jgi:selenocysteine-specific elongation factor
MTPEGREVSLVLGTAGHIDHGKTSLVEALTGVNCDRLMEEKRRGITIELGFAPLRLEKPGNNASMDEALIVSIIDVPGHERFIRQMAAGASGIDAVMLAVAADEGIMPQTREHLSILELLGVKDGLVVVTKSDRSDMLELVEEDIRDFVKGTFLEKAAIVPVSAQTGHNMDVLRKELTILVDRVRPRPRNGALFLPIDRAFPVAGFGTVVTGTAYRGTAKPGDEVEVLPSGREGRIRNLQVHGKPVNEAYAGQRVAANISGIAVDELARGDVVCGGGAYSATRCFDAVLKVLPSAAAPGIKHWQRVRVYLGAADVLARVSLLDGKHVPPGEEAPAQLITEEDVVCTAEERFIIRFYSPLTTIGGGRVVFPYSHKPRGAAARRVSSARIRALDTAGVEARFQVLVEQAGIMDFDKVAASLQETHEATSELAARALKLGSVVELKGDKPVYVSRVCFEGIASAIAGALGDYHSSHASERGMRLDDLSRAPALDKLGGKAARSLITLLSEKKIVIIEDSWVRLPNFERKDDEAISRDAEALFSFCKKRAFQLPTLEEARDELLKTNPGMGADAFSSLIGSLKNSRRLALLPGEFLLTDEVENDMMEVLLKTEGGVTLASVRDATKSSRKFILPILEYFDSKGHTRRVVDPKAGDVRIVRRQKNADIQGR